MMFADGFGLFNAHNTTHASWQWVQTLKPTGVDNEKGEPQFAQVRSVEDSLTMVVSHHGPRTPL